jgi:hypothetical protein
MRWVVQCFPRRIDERTDRCFITLGMSCTWASGGDLVTKAINYVIVHLSCYGTRIVALSLLCKTISDE